jgi:hypothetical protein
MRKNAIGLNYSIHKANEKHAEFWSEKAPGEEAVGR